MLLVWVSAIRIKLSKEEEKSYLFFQGAKDTGVKEINDCRAQEAQVITIREI